MDHGETSMAKKRGWERKKKRETVFSGERSIIYQLGYTGPVHHSEPQLPHVLNRDNRISWRRMQIK